MIFTEQMPSDKSFLGIADGYIEGSVGYGIGLIRIFAAHLNGNTSERFDSIVRTLVARVENGQVANDAAHQRTLEVIQEMHDVKNGLEPVRSHRARSFDRQLTA